jgi:RNA polymerase sigma factor (sigma-70 family)
MGTLRRDTVTKMFSTFLKLDAGRFSDWIRDPNLHRNIQNHLERYPDKSDSEEFWVKHWHGLWKEPISEADLAKMHLFAYLQEPMYWAATQMLKKFTSSQRHLEDYFQDSTHYLQTVLKKFDPKSGELKGFAGTVLLNSLRADIRGHGEASLCTVWALLRKVAKKHLVEALRQEGFSKPLIDQYCLAWKCFKEVYVPVQLGGTHRLSEPSPEQWEEITNLYNQERFNLAPRSPACTAIAIQQWLIRLEGIVRAYLYPKTRSLTVPTDGDTSSEIDIPDRQGSSIDAWLEIEDGWSRQEHQTQAYQVLMATLDSLDPEWKLVLKLYYCQKLTLQKIAANLEKPYAWVQRRVARAQKRLLEALVEWGQTVEGSQGKVNIPLDSNQVKHKGAVLEEWLEIRSRELCSRLL